MKNAPTQRPVLVLALFAVLAVVIQQGCTPEPEQIRLIPNEAPETVVSGAPLDSSNAFHRFQLFWAGFDPDGTILRYFVAVADSNIAPQLPDYTPTTRTDSIIDFTANNEVVLSHSFWVYAVDNEGARDQTPARIFFNAVDSNRPVPIITTTSKVVDGAESVLAFNDTVPSSNTSVTIRWTGSDADIGGSISGYRIKLNTESQFTEIPADSMGATFSGLPSGDYEFVVHALDNAGARSLNPAVWRWVVNREPDTRVVQMFVSNRSGFVEITDFRDNPPTVRDSSRVTLFYAGNDRDGVVEAFSVRECRTDIARQSTVCFPFAPPEPEGNGSYPERAFADTNTVFFDSNDWILVVRAHDNEGKADGMPDSVRFSVNMTPVFDVPAYFPGDGAVLVQPVDPEEPLIVRFRATDLETDSTQLQYRVILDPFTSPTFGDIVSQVQSEDHLIQEWEFPDVGIHDMRYIIRDSGRRADTLDISFEVVAP